VGSGHLRRLCLGLWGGRRCFVGRLGLAHFCAGERPPGHSGANASHTNHFVADQMQSGVAGISERKVTAGPASTEQSLFVRSIWFWALSPLGARPFCGWAVITWRARVDERTLNSIAAWRIWTCNSRRERALQPGKIAGRTARFLLAGFQGLMFRLQGVSRPPSRGSHRAIQSARLLALEQRGPKNRRRAGHGRG